MRKPALPITLALLAALAAACLPASSPPGSPTTTFTMRPQATPALAGTAVPTAKPTQAAAPMTPAASAFTEASVVRVVDGDTIVVAMNGREYRVRYIGVDTPETVHPSRPVEYFGKEASAKNKELVQGKTVKLEKDVSEADRYQRLLRYVWVDEVMVNAELVRLGYAQVATYPPDVKYQGLFLKLQKEAKEAQRGLWGVR